MRAENREEFEYARIPTWWAYGFTGRGVKVAVLEDIDNDDHGRKCVDIIRQIAPDAVVVGRRRPTIVIEHGEMTMETAAAMEAFYRGLVAEGVNIVSMSLYGNATPGIEKLEREILIANGLTLLCAAGNEDGEEIAPKQSAHLPTWISVGAAFLYKGKPRRAHYSETGPQLDVMGFTNQYTTWGVMFTGTSCGNPFVTGVLALVFQYHKQVTGRFPTFDESRILLTTTLAEDMDAPGFDHLTAYGLVRLPTSPFALTTPPRFTDTAGHWAEAAIRTCAEAGLLFGDPDGQFRPDDTVTRAELATVLARLIERRSIQ